MPARSWIPVTLLVALAAAQAAAQPPSGATAAAEALVTRMMVFDKDSDGKLSRAELTDERLQRLFDRADGDQDGAVTKAELTALATREAADDGPGGPAFGPPPGGPMRGFRPGQVLPEPLQQALGLTADQRTRLQELQKNVDAQLGEILTGDQKARLQTIRPRGFGPPPGRPPGGGPPPDNARPPR
jgi:Ca2+-binding EF-hand superfamily protein